MGHEDFSLKHGILLVPSGKDFLATQVQKEVVLLRASGKRGNNSQIDLICKSNEVLGFWK